MRYGSERQAAHAGDKGLMIAQAFGPAFQMVGGQVQQIQRLLEFGALDDLRMFFAVADEIAQRHAGGNALKALRGLGIVVMTHGDGELRGQFPALQQRRPHFGMRAAKDRFFPLHRGGIRRLRNRPADGGASSWPKITLPMSCSSPAVKSRLPSVPADSATNLALNAVVMLCRQSLAASTPGGDGHGKQLLPLIMATSR